MNINNISKFMIIITLFSISNNYGAAKYANTQADYNFLNQCINANNINGVREALKKLVAVEGKGHNLNLYLNLEDTNGYTPLMRAVLSNNEAIVDALLKTLRIEINKRNVRGNTALILAGGIGNLRIINMLSAFGADSRLTNNDGIGFEERYNTYLKLEKTRAEERIKEKAIREKELQEKKEKEVKGKQKEEKEEFKEESKESKETASSKGEQDILDRDFFSAIISKDKKKMETLLNEGANLFAVDENTGSTALIFAVAINNIEILNYLIDQITHRANDFRRISNGTMLHEYLRFKNKANNTAMSLALKLENLFAVTILESLHNYVFGYKPNNSKFDYQRIIAKEFIKRQMQKYNNNINFDDLKNKLSDSLEKLEQHEKELKPIEDEIDVLEKQHAELTTNSLTDDDEEVPLDYFKGIKERNKRITEKKTFFEILSAEKAKIEGFISVLKFILNNEFFKKINEIEMPQHKENQLECSPNQKLLEAICRFNIDDIIAAVENGADVNIEIGGYTPLTLLIEKFDTDFSDNYVNSIEILAYLIKCGADLYKQNENKLKGIKEIPLFKIIESGYAKILTAFLTKLPINLNIKNTFEQTPLMVLINESYLFDLKELFEIIKYFVNHSSHEDINAVDKNGDTVLMYAAYNLATSILHKCESFIIDTWKEIIVYLLENRANPTIKNKLHQSMITMFKELKLDRCLKEIIEKNVIRRLMTFMPEPKEDMASICIGFLDFFQKEMNEELEFDNNEQSDNIILNDPLINYFIGIFIDETEISVQPPVDDYNNGHNMAHDIPDFDYLDDDQEEELNVQFNGEINGEIDNQDIIDGQHVDEE